MDQLKEFKEQAATNLHKTEEELSEDAVKIAETLEIYNSPEGEMRACPLSLIFSGLEILEGWQSLLMSWVSSMISTPEQKGLNKGRIQKIRCSGSDLGKIISAWLIIAGAYSTWSALEIQQILKSGFLVLYLTVTKQVGSMLLMKGDKRRMTLNQGDRLIEINSLLPHLKTNQIFTEVGILRGHLRSKYPEYSDTSVAYPSAKFLLPLRWWPKGLKTLKVHMRTEEASRSLEKWLKEKLSGGECSAERGYFLGYQKELLMERLHRG